MQGDAIWVEFLLNILQTVDRGTLGNLSISRVLMVGFKVTDADTVIFCKFDIGRLTFLNKNSHRARHT